jgi:hypothetical protein
MTFSDLKSKFFKQQWVGLALILVIVLILFGFFIWQNKRIIRGEVLSLDLVNRQIELKTKDGVRVFKINDQAPIINEKGIPIALSEIMKGYSLSAKLIKQNEGLEIAFLKVLKAPDLIIDSPKANEKIKEKIVISGRVKLSPKELYLTLKDQNKNVLLTDKISKNVGEITPYLEFSKELPLPLNCPQFLWLEIYQKDPESGALSDKITIPLVVQ